MSADTSVHPYATYSPAQHRPLPASRRVAVTGRDLVETTGLLITRSHIAVALGLVWLLDGFLQLQPAFFTRQFTQTLSGAAASDPPALAHPLTALFSFTGDHIALFNWAFALMQIAIGIGLMVPTLRKRAIVLSIPWALAVWVVGENLGGIASASTSIIAGSFPGTVLLYLWLAAIVWPQTAPDDGPSVAASSAIGERGLLWGWSAIWGVGALLTLWAGAAGPSILNNSFTNLASGEPQPVSGITTALANAAGGRFGWALTVLFAGVALVIAVAPHTAHHRKRAIVSVIAALGVMWVGCQALGALYTGQATDVSSAPLFALIIITLWPREQSSHDMADDYDAHSPLGEFQYLLHMSR